MKAIVYHRYGAPDVLEYADVAQPTPADGQVLIKVRAASVNPYDWHFMRGEPRVMRLGFGLRRPKLPRLGVDVAGIVESAGKTFHRDDEVFGACRGALAEYAVASESSLALKPANVSFEEAAAVPVAAITALQGLRKANVQPGHKVAINGAAGGVGTFAVQLAKSFGAEVTAVCSTRNVDLVRSIGADEVIDYTREDFTRNGRRYDILLDNVGNRSLSACRRALKPKGTYVAIGARGGRWIAPLPRMLGMVALSFFVSEKVTGMISKGNKDDLNILRELLESGTVKAIIDRRYPLSETAEAIRYLETGHARGKVVVTV